MSSLFCIFGVFMTEKEIGKILKKIKIEMTKKGINQSQLATKLGLTHAAVSAWFNGKSTPNLEMLLKVFGILDRPSNYFFADESTNQTIFGHHNNMSFSGKDFELINSKIDVIQKTLENFDLRLKFLEKK